MPLMPGQGQNVVSNNIAEMMNAYGAKGSIGKTKPRNKNHARLIAIAAAMNHAGLSQNAKANAKEKPWTP